MTDQIKVEIEYCSEWNYLTEASSLAGTIKNEVGIDVNLVEGHGGIFQVNVNGKVVFDKAGKPGRPQPPVQEILREIGKCIQM